MRPFGELKLTKKLLTRCIFHGWIVVFEAFVLRRHPVNLQN